MKYNVALILAFLASAYAQTSSTANPFTLTPSFAPRAGSSIPITWNPTTSGTVSIFLRSGPSNNLVAGAPVASNIANSGSYTWTVPSSITRGSDYALEIRTSDGLSNYSSFFVIESTNTVATNTNPSSSVSATATASSSAAASSSSGSVTVTATTSATVTSTSGSVTTTATTGTTRVTTSAVSTTNSAGFQSTSSTSTRTGAAPRATAAAGLMGAVALAALAL